MSDLITVDPEEYIFPNFQWKEFLDSFQARSRGYTDAQLYTISQATHDNIMKVVGPALQRLRDELGVPVHLNSCNRLLEIATKVFHNPGSAHCFALAADILVDGYTPEQLLAKIAGSSKPGDKGIVWLMEQIDQIIVERGCVHLGWCVPTRKVPRHEVKTEKLNGKARPNYPLIRVWSPD